MTATENVLEDKADNTPGNVVDGAGGRDGTSSGEDDGEVEITNPAVREALADKPADDGTNETNKEEEREGIIDLSLGELPSRANDTPDDTGSTEDLSRWADESIPLVGVTHVGNVREHPGLDTELYGSGNDGGDNLRPEHGPGRDLHIVTDLEVSGKLQCLGHCNITPSLEHHHGDRSARKGITDDEFSNDIKTNLLVSDSLNHSNGYNVDV